MKYTITIFVSWLIAFASYGQIAKGTIGRSLPIVEIILWDTYTPNSVNNFHPTCITKHGNIADLAAYINLAFTYPEYCIELYMEGRTFYKVTLDPVPTVVELKPLCQNESKQLEEILKGIKINLPPGKNEFTIEIKVAILLGEFNPMKVLPNW